MEFEANLTFIIRLELVPGSTISLTSEMWASPLVIVVLTVNLGDIGIK